MSQLSTNRHLRWSLLALPVAGVLVLAGCSGSADNGSGDSTEDPGNAGFSVMVAPVSYTHLTLPTILLV